jgi:hypothetical protein
MSHQPHHHPQSHRRGVRRWTALVIGGLAGILGVLAAHAANAAPPPPPTVSVVDYDAHSSTEYAAKWSNPYGPLDGVVPQVSSAGAVRLTDVPFKPGTDFSVFDHLKYIAISNQSFTAPRTGSITFSVDIAARTPGAVHGHVVHGVYGPPGSAAAGLPGTGPYSAALLEGQQAGVVLNMIDFCTGQLFDWFVSGNYAFPLVERLPTSVTGNTSNPGCPGATEVGLDTAYTQIITNIRVAAEQTHRVAITFTRAGGQATVTYTLDGTPVAVVTDVGVPLDQRRFVKPWTGIYPSLGPGERLARDIGSFSIGHGLFSLLDAYPFQLGCSPVSATPGVGECPAETADLSVSISPSERSFGQGADGVFSNFRVRTLGS